MVKFCPKCEGMLKKSKVDGVFYMVCPCGYKEPYAKEAPSQAINDVKKKAIEMKILKGITQIKDGEEINNPTVDVTCPKCKHTKAQYFQLQTRSADEPATTFYECLSCHNRWRDYG